MNILIYEFWPDICKMLINQSINTDMYTGGGELFKNIAPNIKQRKNKISIF